MPVITAAISPYAEIRDEAHELMGDRFIEVYVKASVDTCAERDVKGLYAKAFAGEIKEFTGVSDPYEVPENPAWVCDTEERNARGVGAEAARVPRVAGPDSCGCGHGLGTARLSEQGGTGCPSARWVFRLRELATVRDCLWGEKQDAAARGAPPSLP